MREVMKMVGEDLYNEVILGDLESEVENTDYNYDEDMDEILTRELKYLVRNSNEAKQLEVLVEFDRMFNHFYGWKISEAKKHLIARVGNASILSRVRNVEHIITHAYDDPQKYRIHNHDYILKWIKRWFDGESKLSTEMAVKERQDVVDKLRKEYAEFLKGVKDKEVDEWAQQIKSVEELVDYTKHIMDALYMDALLVFLQQYSMGDIDIYSLNLSNNKRTKIFQTGFSLAFFGDPGTGKTYSTDDLLRGNTLMF